MLRRQKQRALSTVVYVRAQSALKMDRAACAPALDPSLPSVPGGVIPVNGRKAEQPILRITWWSLFSLGPLSASSRNVLLALLKRVLPAESNGVSGSHNADATSVN